MARGETITITLGWPDKVLSPNSRAHFMQIARAKKVAREEAFWATKVDKPLKWKHSGGDILIRQIAHPPDKRDRDRDNLDHSLKAHRDGIAEALGVNDKHFRPTGIEWGEPCSGGRIIMEIAA